MVGFSNENGNINYSEEVLAKVVGLSTMECYGVVGMVSKSPTEGLWTGPSGCTMMSSVSLSQSAFTETTCINNGMLWSSWNGF